MARHLHASDICAYRLGIDDEPIDLESRAQVRAASLALVSQAQRYVDIVSRDLERRVYDQAPFLSSLQRVVLGSRRARIRILTQQIDNAVTYGHRLLDLVRRVPSFVEIRLQGQDYQQYNNAFLVSDRTGFVHREAAHRFEGLACFHDRHRAATLVHEFEQMWQTSRSHPDLRRIAL